jgi:hypothetical protein
VIFFSTEVKILAGLVLLCNLSTAPTNVPAFEIDPCVQGNDHRFGLLLLHISCCQL